MGMLVLVVLVTCCDGVHSERHFACEDVLAIGAQPDVFTFDAAEEWKQAHENGVDCCLWAGVSCMSSETEVSEIVLRGVSGNASALSFSFSIPHIRLFVANGGTLHGVPFMPRCAADLRECTRRLAILGPLKHERAGQSMPRVTLPLWRDRDEFIAEVVVMRVNLTAIPSRLMFSLVGEPASLRVEDVELVDGHAYVETVHATFVNVRGLRVITGGYRSSNTTIPHRGAVIEACPDLTHIDGLWTVHASEGCGKNALREDIEYGDSVLYGVCSVRIESCPNLVKVPYQFGGPGGLALYHLPKLAALPRLDVEMVALDVEGVAPHVVERLELPSSDASRLRYVRLAHCQLRRVPGIPAGVEVLDVSHNELTEFPGNFLPRNATVATAPIVSVPNITLDHNPIVQLPPHFPLLRKFACRMCNLTGSLDLSSAHAHTLDVRDNALTDVRLAGTEVMLLVSNNDIEELLFPRGVLPNVLEELHARNNKLVSLVGRDKDDSPMPESLTVLDVSGNLIESLPDYPLPRRLGYVDVSHNKLTKLPILGVANPVIDVHWGTQINIVKYLNVSHNALEHIDTSLLAHSGSTENQLLAADFSHNALRDWSEVRRFFTRAFETKVIRLEHNQLHIDAEDAHRPFFPNVMPGVVELYLGHNNFAGVLPDLFKYVPAVKQLDILEGGWAAAVDKPECRSQEKVNAVECMGQLRGRQYALYRNGTTLCPGLSVYHVDDLGVETTMPVDTPPMYHKYWMCRCQFGHFAEADADGVMQCRPAPLHAVCPGGHRSREIWPSTGHWLRQDECEDTSLAVALCPREFREYCAPDHTVANVVGLGQGEGDALSECADGYTGRMCSECAEGYFRWSNTCWKCAENADASRSGVVFAVLGCVAFVLGVAYWLPARGDAAFRIALLAVQLMALTMSVHNHYIPALQRYLHMWGMSLFDMPYINGCLESHSAFRDIEGALVVSAMAVGVPALVWAIGLVVLLVRRFDASAQLAWRTRNLRAMCILVWLVFQRITAVLPMYFQCESDECTGVRYFARFPFHRCDGWAPAAITLFCFFVVPLPALTYAWVRVRGAATMGESDRTAFGFLTNGYKPEYAWYESALLLLKVVIGLFAGLLVSDRVFSPYLVFSMLLGAYYVQHRVQPYEGAACNTAAGFVLGVEAAMFAVAAASNVLAASVGLGSLIIVVHTAVAGVVIMHVMGVLTRTKGRFNLLARSDSSL